MPGKIIRVLVEKGDTVTAGQAVVVVEAMKMENQISAPREGRVTKIRVSAGEAVDGGATLLDIEPT